MILQLYVSTKFSAATVALLSPIHAIDVKRWCERMFYLSLGESGGGLVHMIRKRPEAPVYRVIHSPETHDWHVLDPVGGAICRTRTYEKAEEVSRWLTLTSRERRVEDAYAC
jgi:hypothetical protein